MASQTALSPGSIWIIVAYTLEAILDTHVSLNSKAKVVFPCFSCLNNLGMAQISSSIKIAGIVYKLVLVVYVITAKSTE